MRALLLRVLAYTSRMPYQDDPEPACSRQCSCKGTESEAPLVNGIIKLMKMIVANFCNLNTDSINDFSRNFNRGGDCVVAIKVRHE